MTLVDIKGKYLSLFTPEQIKQLIENGIQHAEDHDAVPCAYLLGTKLSYLISEINPEDSNIGYGIYFDNDVIVKGYIDLEKLEYSHLNEDFLFNFKTFKASYPISIFKAVADEIGDIVPDDKTNRKLFEKHIL